MSPSKLSSATQIALVQFRRMEGIQLYVCVYVLSFCHSVIRSLISTTRVGEECVHLICSECIIQMIWSLQGRFCGWPHRVSNSLTLSQNHWAGIAI